MTRIDSISAGGEMTGEPKKRLVFCFDGTWNRIDAPFPTNVVLTAESVLPRTRDGDVQVVYYDEGVGTGQWEKWTGGVFGAGLLKNLGDAYRALLFNHTPGDEIYIFGFSRGAFSARSFAGLISTVGILSRKDAAKANEAVALYKRRADSSDYREEVARFRATYSAETTVSEADEAWRTANLTDYAVGASPRLRIRYLGVWDTVGALGIPRSVARFGLTSGKYRFHDLNLSPFVEEARHAVALDERRVDFGPTLWENIEELNEARGIPSDADDAPYQQRWFPGTHGGVGGGGDRRGLSDSALEWIWDGARHAGLELDLRRGSRVFELRPDHTEYVDNVTPSGRFSLGGFVMGLSQADRVGPTRLSNVAQSARRRWKDQAANLKDGSEYRPGSLVPIAQDLDGLNPDELGLGGGAPDDADFDLYEVVEGDMLSKLAQRYYGDFNRWQEIFDANKYKVSDPDRIYVGQVLRIPKAQAKRASPTVGPLGRAST